MQRIEFQKAPNDMTRDQVLWKNINIALACSNMGIVFNAMTAWLKYNKELGYQGLEKEFRKHKLDAYLLAKPTSMTESPDMKFVDQFTLGELEYQLIILMKEEKEAMEEILKYHKSYAENFRKINRSGIAVERKTLAELKRARLNMFTFNSDIMLTNLCAGDMIMIPIRVSLENEFSAIFKKYQNTDYTLRTKEYGTNKEGQQVFAMTGEKNGVSKLLSSIGMMMGNPITGDEDEIKFVLLQDQSTWTWEESAAEVEQENYVKQLRAKVKAREQRKARTKAKKSKTTSSKKKNKNKAKVKVTKKKTTKTKTKSRSKKSTSDSSDISNNTNITSGSDSSDGE